MGDIGCIEYINRTNYFSKVILRFSVYAMVNI